MRRSTSPAGCSRHRGRAPSGRRSPHLTSPGRNEAGLARSEPASSHAPGNRRWDGGSARAPALHGIGARRPPGDRAARLEEGAPGARPGPRAPRSAGRAASSPSLAAPIRRVDLHTISSSTKHQRQVSPGSKLATIAWSVVWKCFRACRFGELSQQPTWPQLRQRRRWIHESPVRRHSSQPSGVFGETSRI